MSTSLSYPRGPAWSDRVDPRAVRLARALVNVLLGPTAMLLAAGMVYVLLSGPDSAFDFRHAYWLGGQRVLHGLRLYSWTPAQYRHGFAFVYPALAGLLYAPASLMSRDVGSTVFTLLTVALVPGTLWMLRVRDWRVYGISFLWMPVFGAMQTANETLILVFGVACLWRYRDRPLAAGLLTAVLISLKPLMWPLALWLLATRRWRACGAMAVSGLVLNGAAWGVIGFNQLTAFFHASGVDTDAQWRGGYGLPALLAHAGLGRGAGTAAMLIAAAALMVVMARSARMRRSDAQLLILTVALMLVASPLVWPHYFALLLVPMALLRPRMHWLWALPFLMWVCPPDSTVHGWQALVVWLCCGGVLALLTLQRHERGFLMETGAA